MQEKCVLKEEQRDDIPKEKFKKEAEVVLGCISQQIKRMYL